MTAPANAFLSVNNIVNVTIIAPGAQLGVPNMSNLAFVTLATKPSNWAASQTYAAYNSPQQVAVDFGSTSDMYNMAVAVFSQSPNILSGGGNLIIIPRLQSPSTETTQACLTRIAGQVFFAGFCIDESMDSEVSVFLTLAAYCQAANLIFFYTTPTIANLQPGSNLDQLRTGTLTYTRGLYYGVQSVPFPNSQTQIFSAAYAGRGMSVNFLGTGTVSAMQLQTLAGIQPDQTLNQTTYLQAQAAGVDLYVAFNGAPSVATSGANLFFDQVYDRTWLAYALQVAGFNYLKNAAQVPGKIPQTEVGMTGLKNAYQQVFNQGLQNGYMTAGGTWQLPFSFGNPALFASNITNQGWYMVSQPVSQLTVPQLQSRVAPVVQVAIQEAGGINSSSIIVQVQP